LRRLYSLLEVFRDNDYVVIRVISGVSRDPGAIGANSDDALFPDQGLGKAPEAGFLSRSELAPQGFTVFLSLRYS
jgi:hypothetical protein